MNENYRMMTRDEAIREHRKMWNWIADETLRLKRKVEKSEYFETFKKEYKIKPMSECWCCEFNNQRHCKNCIIDWGDGAYCTTVSHRLSAFMLWANSCNYKKAARYARKIAELPERHI